MAMMTAASSDEYSLAQRVSMGDQQALEAMMRCYNQRLYRAARSVLKDDDEAQEAVQEAYWKAYCAMGQFRADASLSTWLTRIVINEALMRLRQTRRRDNVIQLGIDLDVARSQNVNHATVNASEGPDQLAWRSEMRRLIEHHVDRLPEVYRIVFVLRAVEDMSSIEVADVLDIPEITVRTRYFRARSLLRNTLGREIEACGRDAFSFAGKRCDDIVKAVMGRVGKSTD
jgi:RNA polymerase sigma-70 factor, ECF subfamily